MAKIESSIVINRPVEEVFEFATSMDNVTQWQSGVVEAKLTSEGPVGVGSTYRYVSELMGRKLETEGEITAYEPNKKWWFKSTGGPFPIEGGYIFEAEGDSTKLTVSFDAGIGGFFKLAEGLVVKQFQKQLGGDNAKLKELLEGQG